MIIIKVKEQEYTLEEARELYNELDQLFGKKTNLFTSPNTIPWVSNGWPAVKDSCIPDVPIPRGPLYDNDDKIEIDVSPRC